MITLDQALHSRVQVLDIHLKVIASRSSLSFIEFRRLIVDNIKTFVILLDNFIA